MINPLLPKGKILFLIQNFDLKKGSLKNSYERRAYESVDDKSLSQIISRNLTGKRFQAVMELMNAKPLNVH